MTEIGGIDDPIAIQGALLHEFVHSHFIYLELNCFFNQVLWKILKLLLKN